MNNNTMLETFTFSSINSGRKLLITGSVHGDEVCGTIACNNIINKIKNGDIELKCGSVTFIPITNPIAHKNNKRFYEVNLNRVVVKSENPKLYEEKIANILTEYIENSDYHLDIHSMNTNGTPFSFADYEEQNEFARAQGLEYIFFGWPSVYKDSESVKDYSTQAYSHMVDTINTTVECGSHKDIKAVDVAEKCILRSMKFLNMIDYNEENNIIQKNILMKKLIFKEKDGILIENKNNLDVINKGEIIARYDDGTNFTADKDYLIIFPKYDASIGEEWFYLGELM